MAFAAARSVISRQCSFANTSTANFPCTSVAVVWTAVPPARRATSSASAAAPPTCPESRGITYRPFSSSTSTGESVYLSFTHGAIYRTAIPAAPINRNAARPHCPPISSARSAGIGLSPSCEYFPGAYASHICPFSCSFLHSLRPSEAPVPVKLKRMIFLFSVPLISPSPHFLSCHQ